MGLPMELIQKIISYLPIMDEKHIQLHNSVKVAYQMRQVVKLYANHFRTEDTEYASHYGCALSWVSTDLVYFLNDEIDVDLRILADYTSFLRRFSKEQITTPVEHERFMEKYLSPAHTLREFTSHLTISEMKLFRYWVKTQLFGKAQALIGSRTHPHFD